MRRLSPLSLSAAIKLVGKRKGVGPVENQLRQFTKILPWGSGLT